MKKSKRFLALTCALFLVAAAGLAGCNKDPKSTGSESSDGIGNSKLEFQTVDGIQYPKLNVENKKIKFLSHWDPNGAELKENLERLNKVYGIEVECIKTTYTQLPTKLASLQASGDAPDVFLYYNAGFPTMFGKEMFEEIDSFVDFSDSFWAPAKNASDMFQWNGKHYMVASGSIARFLWYNKTLFDRNALEDPLSLYNDGKWTWEKLFEYAAEFTQDTDADGNVDQWGIGGNSFLGAMYASKNTGMVTLENGEIKNNVKSEVMDKIMNLAYKVSNTDHSFTWDWQNLFRGGRLAMVYEGNWITSGDEILTRMLKDGEIGFVPHPKFEGDKDARYHAEYGGYLIPKGAKNKVGAQAFITYHWAYGRSDSSRTSWEENVKENGWSDTMIEIYKKVNFGENILTGQPELTCGDSLRFAWEPYRRMQDGNEPWAQLKEEFYPLFQTEIDKEKANMK